MTEISEAAIGRSLILEELFDLTLYRKLESIASGNTKTMLGELIPIEARHVQFWQTFFHNKIAKLNFLRKVKLWTIVAACRICGDFAIHLTLEAIEIHGIKKYLELWERYREEPLGQSVRGILQEELDHEAKIVTEIVTRKINPERIRNIFLGLNDGLVETLGTVSGFFAAFKSNTHLIIIAALTVAVAGSISMAAAAFAGSSSERELEKTHYEKEKFLGGSPKSPRGKETFWGTLLVGISFFVGAMVPIAPVAFGATSVFVSIIAGAVAAILISLVLSFISGMNAQHRILMNLAIISIAVFATYAIGTVTKELWGITV